MTAYDRFEKFYIDDAATILRYARYRVGVDHAEDVVADTFAIAWQKLDDLPSGPCQTVAASDRETRQREPPEGTTT